MEVVLSICKISLAIICCGFITFAQAQQKGTQKKRVLLLQSYHRGMEWADSVEDGVRALYEELWDSGFEVVAVSLDKDLEALAKYLDENKVPWTNLVGEGAREQATKYGVRGIPTMLLVDQEGKVVAVGNKVEPLRSRITELLTAQ